MNQCQDDWYEWLSIAEFASMTESTHQCTLPFMLDTGQHPRSV